MVVYQTSAQMCGVAWGRGTYDDNWKGTSCRQGCRSNQTACAEILCSTEEGQMASKVPVEQDTDELCHEVAGYV